MTIQSRIEVNKNVAETLKDKTLEQKIEIAINDIKNALLENIDACRAEVSAKLRKEKARYVLLKAKERLTALERELMEL